MNTNLKLNTVSLEYKDVTNKCIRDIAIVELACRFPEANDCNKLWENSNNIKSSITVIPSDRLEIDKHYSPNIEVANKSVRKWEEFINQFGYFDAFFCISPHKYIPRRA
jgi:acyl transferase domain-containing protein